MTTKPHHPLHVVVNAGSSTLKLAAFEGNVKKSSRTYDITKPSDYDKALANFTKGKNPQAIVHRMVHGGEAFRKPVKISSAVLKKLKPLDGLAPLHNPVARKCILACLKKFPMSKQFVIFDTEFHETIPEVNYRYAIAERTMRRYGFHGIVCASVIRQLREMKKLVARTIICHLGSGCSVTAVKDGKSIDTTMGFTPLEGLVMGTRAGDLDPGVVLELVKKHGEKKVFDMLSYSSGLKGLSGESDMREVLKKASKGNKDSQLAVKIFCSKAAKHIAALVISLGGIDTLVFSGGIGEHAPLIRAKICDQLRPLGVKINFQKNHSATPGKYFHQFFSRIKLLALHADEEGEMNRILLREEVH